MEFYQEALKVNPESQRAQQGINDTRRRLQKTGQLLWPTNLPADNASIPSDQQVTAPIPIEPTVSTLPSSEMQTSALASVNKKSHQITQLRYKRRWGLILIAPWLVGLVIFKLAPILATLVAAGADFLITGDGDLLALRDRYAILPPAEFVRRL